MAGLRSSIKSLLFDSAADDLGKKDDDLPRQMPASHSATWSPYPRLPARRSALRRLAILVFGGACLFALFKTLTMRHDSVDSPFHQGAPMHDLAQSSHLTAFWHGQLPGTPPPRQHGDPVPGASPKHEKSATGAVSQQVVQYEQTYNGPLRFAELGLTLLNMRKTGGTLVRNKNVLFAAGSYKSAAALIPLACQMSEELKNYVHFALLTKDEMSLDDLKQVNGVRDTCKVIFHDARPDYTLISSMSRMQMAAERAIYHINMHMHPQAVIIDGSGNENSFLLNGFRDYAAEAKLALIELPGGLPKEMSFLTMLDSVALSNWNKATVDIVVRAPAHGSAGLLRLLNSLSEADFAGVSVPHLTIELPHNVDVTTRRFLESFNWPPSHGSGASRTRMLSIRHRTTKRHPSEEENALRFFESFWPTHQNFSHVLLLEPTVQLSRNFFHYLHYSMLHYRYSHDAEVQAWDQRLLGISLDHPTTHVDGIDPFQQPRKYIEVSDSERAEESFLWQAPTSNAMLVFGNKWAEAHDLASGLLNARPWRNISTASDVAIQPKILGKSYPSWMEYLLVLSRVRGYLTVYPSLTTASTVAAVDSSSYTAPEEYTAAEANQSKQRARKQNALFSTGSTIATLDTLWRNRLPMLGDMQILGWQGEVARLGDVNSAAKDYVPEFRSLYGQCTAEDPIRVRREGSVGDLFCRGLL
ncbi:hypothetical protein BROUX41_005998 [Berkeleyomyces rouxiae]|uniref:uncharacterized protein n=1 Tax=Berkeleyomyces rouxiae TaxID=2035830 RepID=UPI003B80A1DF